jgi:hypothetical protein
VKETIKRPLAKKPYNWRTLIWVFLAWLLFIYFFQRLIFPAPTAHTLSYTEFKQMIKNGRIAEVTLKGNEITGKFRQTPSGEEKGQKAESAGENFIFQIFQKNESQPNHEPKGEFQDGDFYFVNAHFIHFDPNTEGVGRFETKSDGPCSRRMPASKVAPSVCRDRTL